MPIFGLYTLSLQNPESMTYRTPSRVRDVSAMLVAMMHLRYGLLSKILACTSDAS